METPIMHNFHTAYAGPPVIFVPANLPLEADNTGLYRITAEALARQPGHLGELVNLMTEIRRAGVDIVDLWDCLCEELALLETD